MSKRKHPTPARPGQLAELSQALGEARSEIHALRSALERAQDAALAATIPEAIGLSLDPSGFLLISLPGAHQLRWALGTTQADHAMTMAAILSILRARRAAAGHPNPVGSPGAPTQADLRALAAASRRAPKRLPQAGRSAPTTLTLEDLDL